MECISWGSWVGEKWPTINVIIDFYYYYYYYYYDHLHHQLLTLFSCYCCSDAFFGIFIMRSFSNTLKSALFLSGKYLFRVNHESTKALSEYECP